MVISPRVKLIMMDGSKQRIQLYERPARLKLDLELETGAVMRGMLFERTGVDEYTQVKKAENAVEKTSVQSES